MKRSYGKALAFAFAFAFAARADITYDVSRTIGTATIAGFIETDGTTGTLGIGDIVDWNLALKSGFATLNLTGPLSGHGSVDTNSILDGDLTATATDLSFDFGAGNAGYLLFQTTGLFGTGEQYYCDAAINQSSVCATGEEIVPVSIFALATYAHTGPLTGSVIIASAPVTTPVPEPSSTLLMLTLLIGAVFSARKQIARGRNPGLRRD